MAILGRPTLWAHEILWAEQIEAILTMYRSREIAENLVEWVNNNQWWHERLVELERLADE